MDVLTIQNLNKNFGSKEVLGGLDMSVPAAYEELQIHTSFMRILQFCANIGLTRIGNFSESVAMQNGTLTDHEKKIYRAVFFSRTMTDDMINETAHIKENAAKVVSADVPILLFCSDGSGGTGFTKESWQNIQTDFAKKNNCDIIYLNCGHYVHDYEYKVISEQIIAFLLAR